MYTYTCIYSSLPVQTSNVTFHEPEILEDTRTMHRGRVPRRFAQRATELAAVYAEDRT